ncbi:MAG: biotin--[acetyl-CoA-carboxylase] ligase [Bacteroidota bacterium]
MTALDLALRARLKTRRLGRPHRHLPSVGSTQIEAAAWAEAGASTGAMVTADTQTDGRGRLGRTWGDEPGRDLALSLVLRPALPAERLGLVGLAAALGVAEALDARTPGVTLKWPNDVLIGGKKAAGVLAETRWTACGGGHRPTVLLGIGLNVGRETFPPGLEARATSLALATGQTYDRAAVLADLLLALESALSLSDAALVREAEARLGSLGQRLEVGFPGTERTPVAGTVLGLGPDGSLRLGTDAGGGEAGEVRVLAGETTVLA